MREMSLRWGLGMGVAAAIMGVAAQMFAAHLAPTGHSASFDVAIRYLVVAAPLVLLAVGLSVGLAYYAGLRAERDRPKEPPRAPDAVPPWGGERRDSALAGTIVMACYWVMTTLYGLVLTPGGVGTIGSFFSQHVVQGILFLAFGYGMGALGGRAPAARNLLDSIAVVPGSSAPEDGTTEGGATGAGGVRAPVGDETQ